MLFWGISFYLYFSILPLFHSWYNKGLGMCSNVCGMVDIKDPLLQNEKSSTCSGDNRFPLSLSGLLRYVRNHITVNKMC